MILTFFAWYVTHTHTQTDTVHIIYLSGKLHHKSVGPDAGQRRARKMPAKLMFFLLLLLLYLTVAATGVAVAAVVVAIFSRFALTTTITTTITATSWEHFAMLNILELLALLRCFVDATAKCPSNNNKQQLATTTHQQHQPSSSNNIAEVQHDANWNGTCLIAPRCGVNFKTKAKTIGQLVSWPVSQLFS